MYFNKIYICFIYHVLRTHSIARSKFNFAIKLIAIFTAIKEKHFHVSQILVPVSITSVIHIRLTLRV